MTEMELFQAHEDLLDLHSEYNCYQDMLREHLDDEWWEEARLKKPGLVRKKPKKSHTPGVRIPTTYARGRNPKVSQTPGPGAQRSHLHEVQAETPHTLRT